MLEYVDIDNMQISSMVFPGEKFYKYFIDYKDDDCKIKPLLIILPKTFMQKVTMAKLNG